MPGARRPALRSASFVLEEGELVVVTGRTGAGKSTLLGAVNGTVPHFTGGRLSGRVTVCGRDTRTHRPRDLAGVVGVVRQDPLSGFVTDTVEEELAYTLEQLALDPPAMRRRVEEVLDLLGIADLRDAPLRDLSGGQQQRVAIGSVLTASPRLLVLDEPTSALDPTGAEEVLATLSRLVHDLGLTVLVSEHRLERIVGTADRVVVVADDGTVSIGLPREVMATAPLAPPVVHLGRWAGWEPLPLTIRDARRAATSLRADLASSPTSPGSARSRVHDTLTPTAAGQRVAHSRSDPGVARVVATDLDVSHGAVTAVRGVDLTCATARSLVLMGRNGSGKSSLLWALHGSGARSGVRHRADVLGESRSTRHRSRPGCGAATSAWCPRARPTCSTSTPCRPSAARPTTRPARTTAPPAPRSTGSHPAYRTSTTPATCRKGSSSPSSWRSSSPPRPAALLLDEPTRGLDYPAKEALAKVLRDLAAHAAARSRWQRTTSSSPPRWPTGSSCCRRAGSSPTALPRTSCATRPRSRPRSPRCSPRPGCCGSTRCRQPCRRPHGGAP